MCRNNRSSNQTRVIGGWWLMSLTRRRLRPNIINHNAIDFAKSGKDSSLNLRPWHKLTIYTYVALT